MSDYGGIFIRIHQKFDFADVWAIVCGEGRSKSNNFYALTKRVDFTEKEIM